MESHNRHYAIMVKPIGAACNLRCDYCYYLGKQLPCPSAIMSNEILSQYVRQLLEMHGTNAEVEFAWHGGEPTLCGIDFYKKAVALQRKYGAGRNILNTLQTNGTLLNDDWCRFFKDNNFRIGISIDGPEHLHNLYRKDASGNGTFASVMQGIELLRKHSVEYNTLTTVNAANATHGGEVYRFLREISQYIQFLPVVECTAPSGTIAIPPGVYTTGQLSGQVAPFTVPAKAYGAFLCECFDIWMKQDVGRVFVQIFEATVGNMMRRPAGLCVHESVCGHCGVLERDGSLYRCDRYVFNPYLSGNIAAKPMAHLMETNREFGEYKFESLPTRCLHCNVVDLCWGGCPKDRIVEELNLYGTDRHNYLCEGYKTFFNYFRTKWPRFSPTKV